MYPETEKRNYGRNPNGVDRVLGKFLGKEEQMNIRPSRLISFTAGDFY